jgi:uncharacterized protein YjiS (DUF1127 family)
LRSTISFLWARESVRARVLKIILHRQLADLGMGRFQVRKLIAMSSQKMFDVGEYIVGQADESYELFVIL